MKNMHMLSRREFTRLAILSGGAAAIGATGFSTPGYAAERVIKMAHFMSPRHPIASRLMYPWAEGINKANLGLQVQKFAGGQIGGSPPGAFKRIVNGISDVEFAMQGYTSTVFPRTMVVEIPLQWGSPSEATRALWGVMDKHLASEYRRVELLAMWTTDTPVVMTNKLVRHPDDMKGLKIRTPSANQAAIIRGLGAIPVAMPMPQTYGALEKGVVDGAIVGISVVNSFRLAEVVKNYIIDLPFGFSPQLLAMNKKAFNSLTSRQKAYINKNRGLELSLKAARLYEVGRKMGIATIEKRSDTQIIKLTAAERAAWEARLKTVVGKWVDSFEKQGLPYRQIHADYLRGKP